MKLKPVTVFGASGRQGQAQVRQLLAQGYAVRAITRNQSILDRAGIKGAEIMPADFADIASLDRACANVDAVFFQPPQVEQPERILAFCKSAGEAAKRAGVKRFVLNSTMWSPDQPCGQPMYDMVLMIENIFAAIGLPLVIFRPTVFMDNWLTSFAKPVLVKEHKYRYPHKPDLQFAPICLDDVAKFMVAALSRDDLIGQRIRIAGSEILGPAQVADILSEAMGTRITYEYQTPRDFGLYVGEMFGIPPGADRDNYAAYFDSFYTFNNDAPQKPFLFDVAPVLKRIPITLETFRNWAVRQNWTTLDDAVGSASR
jgi:uncharacterized protein YbjT (DUF2867 family)